VPAVTEIGVRDAVAADLASIAAVAVATGQEQEWGGADAGYVTHLLTHGRVVVGVSGGSVVGFGATRQIGRGSGTVGRGQPTPPTPWRPSRASSTRAGRCRPRRWPEGSRSSDGRLEGD
jgi:hypothetical protein